MARTNLPPELKANYVCRNDYCLIRMTQIGESNGIAIPEVSIEGKQFHVIAKGPKVEQLEVGDRVLMVGKLNDTYWEVPGVRNLLLIKEQNVVLILREKE